MPRDFKEFAKQNEKILEENKDQAKSMEELLNKYKDMDSGELMANLMQQASKLKSEGKLNDETLNNLSSTLSPFLNTEQQNMLQNLINAIK